MVSDAGTLLVEGGVIDESQLRQALTATVRGGGSLVQNLIQLGFVGDEQLASFFASRLQVPLAEAAQFENLPVFITRLVPSDMVMTHRAVPIMLHQGVLHMALADPTDRAAMEEISFITGYSASPVAAPAGLISEAMARYYEIPPDDEVPQMQALSDSAAGDPEVRTRDEALSAARPAVDSITFAAGPPPLAKPEPAPVQKQTSSAYKPVQDQNPAPSPRSEDPQLVLVESAAGELEELFGMGQKNDKVIHLTQPKEDSLAHSITDAIRKSVDLDTDQTDEDTTAETIEQSPDSTAADQADADDDFVDIQVSQPVKVLDLPATESEEKREPDTESWAKPSVQAAPQPLPARQEAQSGPAPVHETFPGPAAVQDDHLEHDVPGSDTVVFSESSSELTGISSESEEDDNLPELKDSEEARYLISQAVDRDEIARTLIRYARSFMPRAVLFIVKKDLLVGWLGVGKGISQQQVKGIMIPLGSPSVFRTVKETSTDYFGSLPRTTVNDIFLSAIGDIRPRQVLLIPVAVRHKAICILYGDCSSDPGFARDLSGLHLIINDAADAFEKIILEKKMNRLIHK